MNMYVCFKCGKSLSSSQALEYHLNKKVKCLSLECKLCNSFFSKKKELHNHMLNCGKIEVEKVNYNDQGKAKELILTNGLHFVIEAGSGLGSGAGSVGSDSVGSGSVGSGSVGSGSVGSQIL